MAYTGTLDPTVVRTRFPCGALAGDLADRYASYDDIPLLVRATAVQCGSAGYWYARPTNPIDSALDAGSRITGEAVQGVDTVRQGAENLLAGAAKWLLLGGGVLLWLASRRRD